MYVFDFKPVFIWGTFCKFIHGFKMWYHFCPSDMSYPDIHLELGIKACNCACSDFTAFSWGKLLLVSNSLYKLEILHSNTFLRLTLINSSILKRMEFYLCPSDIATFWTVKNIVIVYCLKPLRVSVIFD